MQPMSKQGSVFEEQIANLRYVLAKALISQEDWIEAAQTLQEIALEGGRVYPPAYKVKVYVKIAQLYLEEEKSLEAERFLNKAAPLVNKKGVKPKDKLRYQSALVQIRDYNRKFSEAASGYYRLAQLVPESERAVVLEAGVKTAVLGPAGPQRSRILALYYKHELASSLPNFSVLEKMFLGRILRPDEVKAFEGTLEQHQLAKNAEGVTILEQAIREHNVLAASRIYNNITFEQLGTLLDVSRAEAENLASNMITEERLVGRIDQMAGLIYFSVDDGVTSIQDWDAHIEQACNVVNGIVDLLTARHPEWVAAHSK